MKEITQSMHNETLARWEERASKSGYSVDEYLEIFLNTGVEPMPRKTK